MVRTSVLLAALTYGLAACGSARKNPDATQDGAPRDAAVLPDAPDASNVPDTPLAVDQPTAADKPMSPDVALTFDAGSALETAAADGPSPSDTGAVDATTDTRPAMGHDAGAGEAGPALDGAALARRVVLYAAPSTILASANEDVVVYGQLQDGAGNPVLTTVEQAAAIRVTLASSDTRVLVPTYSAGDERGTLVFEKVNNPNWTSTFFKATATSGSATISGTAPGLEVVPVSVATAAKGGAPAAVRIFAMPPRVPAAAVRNHGPMVQLVDGSGIPTYGGSNVNVTITSDNQAVAGGGSVLVIGGFSRFAATISVPGAVGTATLTASATGLVSGTATFSVVP